MGPLVERILSPCQALHERLKARVDSEHKQALIRIGIVSAVLLYMAFFYSPDKTSWRHAEPLLIGGLACDLVLALAIFLAICAWPAPSIPRRAIGMLTDAGTATFCIFLAGASGVSMIGVYLFITFGNGFRYGIRYLFACQALCLVGFLAALFYAPYWVAHNTEGWCLMIALVVLPYYVSKLLKPIEVARTKAEEANRAKSSFLANMSHEMRTPLNGIVGVADLLQTTALDSQQSELMRLLRHSVMLLRSLVDDVLDISKIEAGRLTIEVAEFDLHATLNGLVRLLRPHAQAKGLALHAMVDPAIDYRLRGDSHHLRQVLLNLLSNAIKFTDRGEINIDVSLLAETEEGLRVRFEVRDTGIGIGEEVQRRIFERFVQADNSTTRRYGGTGLGTTIAKQLVELMGGAIGVKSALGVGSTFWFELPLLKTVSIALPPASVSDSEARANSSAAIVVAEPQFRSQVLSLVEAACGHAGTLSSEDEVTARIKGFRDKGIDVLAVVVASHVDVACKVFERLSRERGDMPIAMIHMPQTTPSRDDLTKLHEIESISCLNINVSPRVLRNAIHAATTRGTSDSAEIIDLGKVLQEQRQPLRILVAEDNLTNQTIIRKLLESAGHTVLIASDGEEALDRYEEGQAELAILDFNMPERNGIEVVTAIRTMEPTGTRLPVIILSASVTAEARERARMAGADEFVGKPFEAASLLQVIDRLARRATRSQQSRYRATVPSQPATVALIDYGRIQEVQRISRDAEFIPHLFGGFRGDVEALLKRLDVALASEQRSAIADVTHAIRGAALGIGAQQLAARCEGIEQVAATAGFNHLRTLAAEARRCFDATSAQLTTYAANKVGTSD